MNQYNEYEKLCSTIRNFSTTPILFIGSGISRRYYNLPSWRELLETFTQFISKDEYKFSQYMTLSNKDFTRIASLLESDFNKAWYENPELFILPEHLLELIKQGISPFKCAVAHYIDTKSILNPEYNDEIELLKTVLDTHVTGIITTNYDTLIETYAPNYITYNGQDDLLFSRLQGINELYKIHGSTTNPESIIITADDYENFNKKRTYLIAKLLTHFIEYPIIFIGYSMNDTNIQNIFKSIEECLTAEQIEKINSQILFISRSTTQNDLVKFGSNIHISMHINQGSASAPALQMQQIYISDFKLLYNALKEKKASIPLRLLRMFREEFYQYTLYNKPQKHLAISLMDEKLPDDALLVAVGSKDILISNALKMITRDEWYLNTIQDTLPYDADDMLSIAYPIILASNSILPPFKYLSKARHKYPDIEAKATYTCINDLLNTTIKKERNKDKYIGMTFADLTQNYDDLKILGKIPYLADTEIESIDLKSLLVTTYQNHPNIFSLNPAASDFRRLIRIYDWLTFGR